MSEQNLTRQPSAEVDTRRQELREGLERTRARIAAISQQADRKQPKLLTVTKFHPVSDIAILKELGISDVAENREQEARAKAAELPGMRFHMIGQIQTKKANHVARWAHSVHSLDSSKLAVGLDRGIALARERGEREDNLRVFIQVSADADSARGGIALSQVDELVREVEGLEHLWLCGFMVVPPLEAEPKEVFEKVRALTDEYSEKLDRQLLLSAGMSADLEAAIVAGSDIVRVGTGIMGPRPVV